MDGREGARRGVQRLILLRVVPVRLASLGLLALLLGGCSSTPERETLTVFAAASLAESFAAIEAAFEAEQPGVDVVVAFAGSQLLATQLLEGASADLFASANPEQLDRAAAGRSMIERRTFTTNRLVLAFPRASVDAGELAIDTLAQLDDPGVRVVLAGEAVPAGHYAREALRELGLHDAVMANVVSYELDVRGVVGKLLAGEADAGIVYATDLRGVEDRLASAELGVAIDARYELALVGDSNHLAAARAFAEFVSGPAGQAILREHGFAAHHD